MFRKRTSCLPIINQQKLTYPQTDWASLQKASDDLIANQENYKKYLPLAVEKTNDILRHT